MRAGPSGSDCRIRVQTTASCFGPMAEVVSVAEKAGRTRQVCAGKTNASEPLMTCRKRRDVTETRLQLLAWEEARRVPADCPSGDRHEDGVRPARGSCAERGNLSPRCQGRTPGGGPRRSGVPMRGAGAEGSVGARKPGNAGGAKGPDSPAEETGQPAMGGACVCGKAFQHSEAPGLGSLPACAGEPRCCGRGWCVAGGVRAGPQG